MNLDWWSHPHPGLPPSRGKGLLHTLVRANRGNEMMSRSKLGYLAILLTVVLGVAPVACGAESGPATSPVVAPTTAPPAMPEPTATTMPAPSATPVPTATAAPPPVPTATPRPTATPVPTPTPESTPAAIPYPAVSGIVDVSNRGWPREVETADGLIRLEGPPQRILSYSLGHDEILLALVDKDRFAAVGPFTGDSAYSNVAEQAANLPIFEKGVENVLAARPDLVIVSKFTDADIVGLIQEAGVPVARPALESSAEGNIPTILLMGYMLGVEERALELVAEIEGRIALVTGRVPPPGDSERPSVISMTRYSDVLYAAGADTTEGGILETAGGVNAAARDGIAGHQTISVESIAAMNPDVILITQPVEYGANELRDDLLSHAALAEVSAVKNEMVHVVDSRKYTTLSHWNVRGIEQTALMLYPDRFDDVEFSDFEPYEGE